MSVEAVVTGPPWPTSLREVAWFVDQDRQERLRRGAGALRGRNWLTIAVFRLGQYTAHSSSIAARFLTPPWKLIDFLYLRLLLHAEYARSVACGPGLVLVRGGANAGILAGCVVGARVYMGGCGFGGNKPFPVVSDDVTCLPGSQVMGGVVIGQGATIGPNSLVKHDVEPGTFVVGIPARPTPDP